MLAAPFEYSGEVGMGFFGLRENRVCVYVCVLSLPIVFCTFAPFHFGHTMIFYVCSARAKCCGM